MSNLTTKITQTSIEINGKLHFSQIWNGETPWNFTHCSKYENEYIYISDKNIWRDYSPSVSIYSFIKFKLLLSLPKSFHSLDIWLKNALQLAHWPCY